MAKSHIPETIVFVGVATRETSLTGQDAFQHRDLRTDEKSSDPAIFLEGRSRRLLRQEVKAGKCVKVDLVCGEVPFAKIVCKVCVCVMMLAQTLGAGDDFTGSVNCRRSLVGKRSGCAFDPSTRRAPGRD